jgi:aminoglycoside phosphotransferase
MGVVVVERVPVARAILASRMETGLGRARAMAAMAEVGVPSAGLTRADSVTNEVWLHDDYVVRVNRDASLRLRREAALSHALPPEVGYPPLVQHGGDRGDDWLVLQRVPDRPLTGAGPP